LQWATLGIAGFGVLLAAMSLTWQAVTFRLTGSRVVAHLRVGVLTGAFGGQGIVSFQAKDDWEQQLVALQQEHGGTPILILTASNIGRLAVAMQDAQAKSDTKFGFSRAGWALNPATGASLDAGHQASWYVTLEELQRMLDVDAQVRPQNNRPIKCWMELSLGDTTTVRTRETFHITPRPQ